MPTDTNQLKTFLLSDGIHPGEATVQLSFLPPYSVGVDSTGKNLLLKEQILSLRVDPC